MQLTSPAGFGNICSDLASPSRSSLRAKSTLKPTLVIDAKALYDSYHRERISSSVVDKRMNLEIRVMKECIECFGGGLRG